MVSTCTPSFLNLRRSSCVNFLSAICRHRYPTLYASGTVCCHFYLRKSWKFCKNISRLSKQAGLRPFISFLLSSIPVDKMKPCLFLLLLGVVWADIFPGDDYKFHHHTAEELKQVLDETHAECPDITHIYSQGKSTNGEDLWVIEITDNPGQHESGEFVCILV